MKNIMLMIKIDLKLGVKTMLLMVIAVIIFFIISLNYNFESNKSVIYCHIKGDGQYFEFYNKQIEQEKSIILVESEQMVEKSMKNRPFSYGMIIDSETKDVKMVMRGYESNMLKNNIGILGSYIDRSNAHLNDIETHVVQRESTKYKQNEIRAIPLFMYVLVTIMPFFIIISFMFRQKLVIFDNLLMYFDMKSILMTKISLIAISCTLSAYLLLVVATRSQIDYLRVVMVLLLSSYLSTTLGVLVVSYYESIYRALNAIFLTLIIFSVPIIKEVFNLKKSIIINPFQYSFLSLNELVLYNYKSFLTYQAIGYLALLSIFCLLMSFRKYSSLRYESR